MRADCRRAAIFLDRDGVINRDDGYTHRIEDFELLPGVVDELGRLQSLGYLLIVVTNQAGIARGRFTESEYFAFTEHMRLELRSQGIRLAAVYYCPHHEMGSTPGYAIACECRKPRPGMIQKALVDHQLDVKECWLIGDKQSDLDAGIAAGIPPHQCCAVQSNSGLVAIAGRIIPKRTQEN